MVYKITSYENCLNFEEWAKENNIDFEEVDDGKIVECCPNCGDSEFWSGGHCDHCGYSVD